MICHLLGQQFPNCGPLLLCKAIPGTNGAYCSAWEPPWNTTVCHHRLHRPAAHAQKSEHKAFRSRRPQKWQASTKVRGDLQRSREAPG